MKTNIKHRAIRRLNIIQGQVGGLTKMVENEAYCIDIITQTSAIIEALAGVERLVLENHLSTHVIEQIRSKDDATATKEILAVYKLAQKGR